MTEATLAAQQDSFLKPATPSAAARPVSPSGPPPARDLRAKSPEVSPALKRVLARSPRRGPPPTDQWGNRSARSPGRFQGAQSIYGDVDAKVMHQPSLIRPPTGKSPSHACLGQAGAGMSSDRVWREDRL